MIKGRVIEFGYGDLAVGADILGITVKSIAPKQEVGTILDNKIEKGSIKVLETLCVFPDLDELVRFRKMLLDMTGARVVEFKGYFWDFTNADQRSVDVVIDAINYLADRTSYAIPYAC